MMINQPSGRRRRLTPIALFFEMIRLVVRLFDFGRRQVGATVVAFAVVGRAAVGVCASVLTELLCLILRLRSRRAWSFAGRRFTRFANRLLTTTMRLAGDVRDATWRRRLNRGVRSLRVGVTWGLIFAVAAPLDVMQAIAADRYWDADLSLTGNTLAGAGLGGSGVWNLTSPSWWDGAATIGSWSNAANDTAVFWGASGTVSLGSGVTAGGLTFKSSYLLTGDTITFAGATPTISVDAGVSAAIASALDGSAGFTKSGGGTLTLSGTNVYTGTTTIGGGVLAVSADANLGASTNGVRFSNFGALAIYGAGLTTARTITIDDGATATIHLAAGSGTPATTISGAIVGNNLPGTGSLVVSGGVLGGQVAATLNLTGAASTYGGTTTIQNGMTINLSGATAALSATSGITLNGGGLTLTNASTANNANRINNAAGITSNGGTITFSHTAGTASYAEELGTIALGSGLLNIVTSQAASGQTSLLTLGSGSLSHTASNSTIAFGGTGVGTTRNQVSVTGFGQTGVGQIIGPWATVGTTAAAQSDYAAYNITNGAANALGIQGAAIAGVLEASWSNAGNAYTMSTAGQTLSGTRTITALRNTAATNTLTLGSATTSYRLETYGVLNGASTVLTIAPGTTPGFLTTPANGGNLYLTTGAGAMTVSASIIDNGTVTLVKSGSGVLTLSGTNAYTGGTIINGGTISLGADAHLGNTTTAAAIVFNGSGGLTFTAGFSTGRGIVLNNGAQATLGLGNTTMTLSGPISGSGGLSFTTSTSPGAASALTSTNNTFEGPLRFETPSTVVTGVLGIASLADSPTANGAIRLASALSGSPILQLDSNATSSLVLNHRQIDLTTGTGNGTTTGGGTLRNSTTGLLAIVVNTDLLVTGGTPSVRTSTKLTLDGTNTAGNAFNGRINNGILSDGTVLPVSITKTGTGTWALGGVNAFSGGTTVAAGTLIATKPGSLGTGNVTVSSGTLTLTSAGAIASAATLTFSAAAALNLRSDTNLDQFSNAATILSAAGIVTVNVDQLASGSGNTLKLGAVTLSSTTTTSMTVTAGNGYALALGAVTQTNAAGTTATFNNTAPLTIESFTTQSNAALPKLTFTGTGTATITGNITQSGSGALALDRATAAGTLILQGTSNMTGGVTITNGVIQTAVATNAFGSTSGISIGAAGTLALRNDADATFGNATTAYSVSITASNATINVNQATVAGSGKSLTLGNVSVGGAFNLNVTGGNDYVLKLGTVTLSNTGTFTPTTASVQIAAITGGATARNTVLSGTSTGNNAVGSINTLTGTLTKSTAATWTLTGASDYTGATTIGGGILNLTGSLGNTAITVNGTGTFNVNGAAANALSGTAALTVSVATATANINSAVNYTGATTLSAGAININSGGQLKNTAISISASGVLSAQATNALSGGATLSVNGTTASATLAQANDYNGATTLTLGTLRLDHVNAVQNSQLSVLGGTLQLRSDTNAAFASNPLSMITLGGTSSIDVNSLAAGVTDKTLTLGNTSGLTLNSAAVVTVTGGNGYNLTLGSTTLGGAGTIKATTANVAIPTVFGFGNGLTLGGTSTGSTLGPIVNGGSLTKTEAGTWTLTSTNSISGNTTIQNGTLHLGVANAWSASSPVFVTTNAASAALLDFDGHAQTFAAATALTLGGATGSTAASSATVNVSGTTLTLGGDVAFVSTGNPSGALISGGTLELGGVTRTFTIANSTNAAVDLDVTSFIPASSTAGITKSGAGVLALSAANTFTGDLTINGGAVQFSTINNVGGPASNLGQGDDVILNNGGLTFAGSTSQSTNRPITVLNTATLTANGTGGAVITFDGFINYAGETDVASTARATINLAGTGTGVWIGGITQTESASSNSDINLTGGNWSLRGGTYLIADDVLAAGATSVLNLDTTGSFTFLSTGTNTAGNGMFAHQGAVINLNADDVYGVGNSGGLDAIILGEFYTGSGTGSGTLNTNTYRITTPRLDLGKVASAADSFITGTGTVVLTSQLNLIRGSISANLAGSATMQKVDAGTVTLSGDNSGLTVVGALELRAGNLLLDFSTNNAAKLSASTVVAMSGATLTVTGSSSAATVQTLAGVTLDVAQTNQIVVQNGSGQSATLNLGAVTRGISGGMLKLTLPTTGVITTSMTNTFGILGGFATIADATGTYFAQNDGTGKIVALTYPAAKNDVTTWLEGDHITDAGSGFTGTLPTSIGISSLRFNAAGGSTLNVGGSNSLNIAAGGILMTSAVTDGPVSILGGRLSSSVGELIILQESATQTLTISSAIRGAVAITKAGAGAVILNGSNDFTGATSIQAGTLTAAGLGDDAPVTLSQSQASTLQLVTNETIGTLSGGNSTTGSIFGVLALGLNSLTIRQHESGTFAGVITGSGTLTKEIAGTELNLTGASGAGFTGGVVINGGVLRISTQSGDLSGATSIVINKSGSLLLDNNTAAAVTVPPNNRISNTAPITLNSADGTFAGETIVRGFAIRVNGDTAVTETVGTITLGSGASYVTLSSSIGTEDGYPTIAADDLIRSNHSTLNVRGVNLVGPITNRRSQFRIGNVANQNAFTLSEANLVGQGGGTGTTMMSIVPWAIGENVDSPEALPSIELTDANMGNSLVTYLSGTGGNAPTGFRALDWATEYSTYADGGDGNNVRESLTSDVTGLAGKLINALVLHNDKTIAGDVYVTGSGAGQLLTLSSGAFLFTLNAGATAGNYTTTLGGFNSGIAVENTFEYVFHVVNPNSASVDTVLTSVIASPLTSDADVTKSGRGTLILTGNNVAGGGARATTINEGILEIADLDNIGGNSGDLLFAGGALRLAAGFADDLSSRAINILNGGGTLNTNGLSTALAAGLDDATPNAADTFTKTGNGLLTIQGGSSFVGTFVVGHTATGTAADGNAVALRLDGATNAALGGNLQVGSTLLPTADVRVAVELAKEEQIANSAVLSFRGAAGKEAYFKLMGFTETVAGISDTTGFSVIENVESSEAGVATNGALILSGGGNYSFNGTLRDKAAGPNTTNLRLEKVGDGTQALSGANTFSGGVVLGGGVLALGSAEIAGTSGPLGVGGAIRFSGGTLQYSSVNAFDYSSRFSTTAGQAISVDTNGQAVTFAADLTSSGGSLTKLGAGTLTLSGSNSYGGGTTINGGIVHLNGAAALGTGPMSLSGFGSYLRLNGNNATVAGLTANVAGPIIENTHASNASTLTVSLAAGSNTFAGTLQNGAGAALGLTKQGSGTLILSGASTYTGSTNVAGGTLALASGGSLGNTNVTVADGATFAARTGGGTSALGSSSAALTLAGGASFTMADDAIGVFNLNGSLTLGGGSASSLSFEIGNLATGTDKLVLTGAASIVGAGGAITISSLTGNTALTLGSYDLITATGGGLTGGFTLSNSLLTVNSVEYRLSLNQTNVNALQLVVALNQVTATAYWTGDVDGNWNVTGVNTNWSTEPDGSPDAGSIPGGATDVFFTADTAGNLASTLGQDFSIKSLTFTGAGTSADAVSVTIAGANTLTITPASSSTGITVTSTTAAHTISANVVLGALQTWTNNSTGTLTVSGAVANGASNLTVTGTGNTTISGALGGGAGNLVKEGTGTLILSGANTFTGTTTISAGTLQVGDGSTSGTLGTGGVTNNGALVFNRSNDFEVSNAISGAGSLTKNGAGVLTLSGANSYSGATTINAGILAISSAAHVGGGESTDGAITIGAAGTLRWLTSTGTLANAINTTAGAKIDVVAGELTLTGTITGDFTKLGDGILTLGAPYSGTSTFSDGTYEVGANNTGDVVVNGAGATVVFDAAVASYSNDVTLTASAQVDFNGTSGQTTALSGLVTIGSGHTGTLSADAGVTVNLTGGVSKDGSTLRLLGPGTFNVSQPITGSSANSDLVVDGSVTNLDAANTFNGPTTITNGGRLNANVAGAMPTATRSDLTMTGTGNKTFFLSADQMIASLTGDANSTVNLNGRTLTVGTASDTKTYSGTISGGAGSNLVKDGASTLILNGSSHTYSGATTVQAGTLVAQGTFATTQLTVNTNATLSPGGTDAGNDGVGLLTAGTNASLQLNATSHLVFEFKSATGMAGSDWDKIDLQGGQLVVNADNINLANRITIHVNSWLPDNSGPGAAFGFNDDEATPSFTQTYDWLFIAANSFSIPNPQPGSLEGRFAIDDSGVFGGGTPFTRPSNSMGQGTFSVRWDAAGSQGAGLYIHYSAIPEPGSMALAGLGALAAGWYGRRLKKNASTKTEEPIPKLDSSLS